jgi:hypothetical protein
MRDLINSHFGGVMGRKLVLVVGDAPDPIVPKRPAPRYGVKVANAAKNDAEAPTTYSRNAFKRSCASCTPPAFALA